MQRKGWDVRSASTLAEARVLLADDPSVLILDLMLPDGDGTVLLREIRDNGRPIQVIVTTGSSDSVKLAVVSQLRADAILQKPVDLERLLVAIQILK
jgi:two-component system OmpR family response regulator